VKGPVGSGVPQWRKERSNSGHMYSSGRSNDGAVSEYPQYDERGKVVRPSELKSWTLQEGHLPHKKSSAFTSSNQIQGDQIRASPSLLASRPEPRIGLVGSVRALCVCALTLHILILICLFFPIKFTT
jgi:hypothetical protein